MNGKRNVSVCRGHELANALYTVREQFPPLNLIECKTAQSMIRQLWDTMCYKSRIGQCYDRHLAGQKTYLQNVNLTSFRHVTILRTFALICTAVISGGSNSQRCRRAELILGLPGAMKAAYLPLVVRRGQTDQPRR